MILFGKVALSEENEEYFKTNKIQKGNIIPLHQNDSTQQRISKRQIDEESFRAYKCEEENVSTAEFSLNPPPECRREDGSAYYKLIEKKAQILQRIRRIPI